MTKNLFQKYNVAGPRYTSYPTVPYWEGAPTQDQWFAHLNAELDKTKARGEGAAIYMHLPFCESLCTFCGCTKRITKKHERVIPYIKALHQEWEIYKKNITSLPLPVAEVHLGGGTPTFFTPQELRQLLEPFLADVHLIQEAELSFEADPRVTTPDHLQTLYKLGFRRMSLGVQDFSARVQKAINREQSPDMVDRITRLARGMGYSSINFDLVYGLPFQTLADIEETFLHVLLMRPDRIAFYGYAHVPWVSPGQRGYEDKDVPDGEAKRALYEKGRSLLEKSGYKEIGLDHFALQSDALWQAVEAGTLHRNFMGYMPRHVSPMISLGCSAISDAWSAFIQNEKEVETYQSIVDTGILPIHRGHVLSQEDIVLRTHIQNIMCRMKTEWQSPESYTNFMSEIPLKMLEFVNDNLIEFKENKVLVNERGRPFLRNICMAFDARLSRHKPNTPIFSKTI